MVELGIVDIREIVRLINSNYGYDFSIFALTSMKYRLEHIIAKNNLPNPEGLFRKLSDQPDFFDVFLNQLTVPSTEMFRDPSVWRWLRENYFNNLDDRQLSNFKIWLPYTVSGGELFTLTVFLKELNLLDKVKIYATCASDTSIEQIRSGEYPLKKIEVSVENYKRFQGDAELTDFYSEEKYSVIRDTSLIKNVEFIKDDFNYNNAPKNVRLIIMRNALIYFTPAHQEKLMKIMHETLSANGTLVLGLKELIRTNSNSPVLFDPLNQNESIYKKRLV